MRTYIKSTLSRVGNIVVKRQWKVTEDLNGDFVKSEPIGTKYYRWDGVFQG